MNNRYRGSLQVYYMQADRLALQLLDKESPDYLLNVDADEYLDHLLDRIAFQPLLVRWEEESVEPFKAQRQRPRTVLDWDADGPVTVHIEMFRVRVPVDPNPRRREYFELEGSKGYMKQEPNWRFDGDTLIVELPATTEAINTFRQEFRMYTESRNSDIENGNARLRASVEPIWRSRRSLLEANAEASRSTIEKLGLRLYEKPGSPKPVDLSRRRLDIPRPPASPHNPEPRLSDEDVAQLVQQLVAHGRQLETSPDTYAGLTEEKLRNVIHGSLNASFSIDNKASSTSETFSKLGKTDILLKVDGAVPLVVECKFWSGPKAYGEALAQLFDYITWRQGHGVLLHFSKIQDLMATVATAVQAIEADSTTVGNIAKKSESSFVSRHRHPQDNGKSIEVHHLFFDLSLSPSRTRGRGSGTSE